MAEGGIVVGVDGSPGAGTALRWAVDEGRRRQTTVTALLAWSYLDQREEEPGAGFDPGYGEADARAALHAFVEAAVPAEALIERTVCDVPGAALVRASESAELVVVGAHGGWTLPGVRLGSTSAAVSARASCPVAVVRTPRWDGPIVVGIDTSRGAERVLRAAVDEALVRETSLVVVHSWSPPPLAAWALEDDSPYILGFRATADDAFEEALATVDLVDVKVERRLVTGSAAAALLEAEHEDRAQLLVVGASSAPSLVERLLGSVPRQLVHHATGTVLVVRP